MITIHNYKKLLQFITIKNAYQQNQIKKLKRKTTKLLKSQQTLMTL